MDVFEKFHAEQDASHSIPGDSPVLTIRAYKDGKPDDWVILLLADGRGHDILAVTADGQMHFAPGYTPSQQAEAFRQAMNMASQLAVFPLVPPPALASGPITIGQCPPDGEAVGGTHSPLPRVSDPESRTPKTFPIRADVPHPDKII